MSITFRFLWYSLILLPQYAYPFQTSSSDQLVTHYTSENGLPQNSVKTIASDHLGFIWLGTENGLVRFDGRSFEVYDKSDFPLLSSRIYTIQRDHTGRPSRYHAVTDSRDDIVIENGRAFKTPYFYNHNIPGLHKLASDTMVVSSGTRPGEVGLQPQSFLIYANSGAGNAYLLSKGTVNFYHEKRHTGQISYPIDNVNTVFTIAGNLFQLKFNREFWRLDQDGAHPVKLRGDLLRFDEKKDNVPLELYWNAAADQAFLVGAKGSLFKLTPISDNSMDTKLIVPQFRSTYKNIVTILHIPTEDRTFLGSLTDGLYMISPKSFTIAISRDSLVNNIFYAQTLLKDRRLLTAEGLIWKVDNYPGNVPIPSTKAVGIANLPAHGRGLLTGPNGEIWVSDGGDRLLKFDPTGTTLRSSWHLKDEIKTLYKGSDGRIWIGLFQKGLWYLDNSRGKEVPVRFAPGNLPAILYLLEDKNGSLWIATIRGLYRASLRNRKISFVKGTQHLFIRSLFLPGGTGKDLFLTTYEDGFFLHRNNHLIHFPLDANGHLRSSHCIMEDKKGSLWIPTNNGIFQMQRDDLLRWANDSRLERPSPFYLYYSKEDGLLTNEFNGGCQPCALQLGEYRFSFPTMKGLAILNPLTLKPPFPNQELIVDKIEVDGEQTRYSDTVYLSRNATQIKLHLNTPYFGNKKNIRISYRLSNQSDSEANNWISLQGGNSYIELSRLSSGFHNITIRKLGGFGEQNFSQKNIVLVVPVLWYETIWFWAIMLAALTFLVHQVIKLRTARLSRKNRELEEIVHHRTEYLQQTLVALEGSEVEISRQMQMQARLIASISHDIKTPISYFVRSSELLKSFIARKNHEQALEMASELGSTAIEVNKVLENMIAFSRSQFYGESISSHDIRLLPLIMEKVKLFQPMLHRKQLTVINQVSDDVIVSCNGPMLGIIISNIIDNSVKHTSSGTISIVTSIRNDGRHLIFTDTGPGLSNMQLELLNNNNDSASTDYLEDYPNKAGLGLLIIRELAKALNLRIAAKNEGGLSIHIIFSDLPKMRAGTLHFPE